MVVVVVGEGREGEGWVGGTFCAERIRRRVKLGSSDNRTPPPMSVPSSSASFTVRTKVSLTHRGTPTVKSWSSRETVVVVGHRGGGGGGGGVRFSQLGFDVL